MPISNTPHNKPFPFMEKEHEGKIERYLPLPTVQTLKDTSLFGIPLKSAFTGETIPDTTLADCILKAVSELEHALNIFIMPVQFEERHDYNREIWTQQYAWQKLNNSPILDVQSVELSFGNGTPLPPLVSFPLEFCYVNSQEGAIRLVPVLGTPTSGFILSSFAGAQWNALLAAGIFEFPGAVKVIYRAGFDLCKIPAMIAGLIEKMAAYQALMILAPLLFIYTSVSIGIDGTSQSSSNMGSQFLALRLTGLKAEIDSELDIARNYYLKSFIIDFF